MGAHTIGNAEIFNSGFHGPWVSGEATTFNNQYYANLRYSTVQYSTVQYSTVQQPVLRQPQGPGPGLDSDPARLHRPQRGGGQRVRGGADHRVAVHLRGQRLQPPRRHGALPGQGSTIIALHDYNHHLKRFLQNFTVDADGKPSCDYADCDLSETYRW